MTELVNVPWPGLARRSPLPDDFTGGIKNAVGDIAYFKNGEWHREDGPARIYYANPTDPAVYAWQLNGDEYTFDEWCKRTKLTPEEILLLRITYGV